MEEQVVPAGAAGEGEMAGCVGYSGEQAAIVLVSDGSVRHTDTTHTTHTHTPTSNAQARTHTHAALPLSWQC